MMPTLTKPNFFSDEPVKESQTANDTVFFLGAGASVAAGVPTTKKFVDEFIQSVRAMPQNDPDPSNPFAVAIQRILELLNSDGQVDIELLMEALDTMADGSWPLKGFFKRNEPLTTYPDDLIRLWVGMLRQFIRKKTLVGPDKVRYFDPLFDFIGSEPLDIYSVNYDTCIEQLCHVHRKRYTDGFELEWYPDVLNRNDWDIRLYKLHGSSLWYESEHAKYLKVPIHTDHMEIDLFTGEKAKPLMLYPMRKWQYAEPLLELMIKLKRRLEDSEKTLFVVVVGYSFRDDYIKKLFWDAFRRNRNLTMLLVDPGAQQIYEESLKYYKKDIPSSMAGRVVCLPYEFERFLPLLKKNWLKELREGIRLMKKAQGAEKEGDPSEWRLTPWRSS